VSFNLSRSFSSLRLLFASSRVFSTSSSSLDSAIHKDPETGCATVADKSQLLFGQGFNTADPGGNTALRLRSQRVRSAPVCLTWVPPHNSRLKSAMRMVRTISPYFSPNRAMAPCCLAWAKSILGDFQRDILLIRSLTRRSIG